MKPGERGKWYFSCLQGWVVIYWVGKKEHTPSIGGVALIKVWGHGLRIPYLRCGVLRSPSYPFHPPLHPVKYFFSLGWHYHYIFSFYSLWLQIICPYLLVVFFFKIATLLIYTLYTYIRFVWLPQQMITTEIYYLMVLEAWSLKSNCQQGNTAWRLWRILPSSSFSSCWHSLVSLLCGHVTPICLSPHIASFSMCVSNLPLFFSYKGICYWIEGPPQ